MRALAIATICVLSVCALAKPPKVYTIAGMTRQQVTKLLGKPFAVANKPKGYVDSFNVAGFKQVRAFYLGKDPKTCKEYLIRVSFNGPVPIEAALTAVGLNATGATYRRSPSDGSMLVEHLTQLAVGWKVSYWSEPGKGGRSHIDIEGPGQI